MSTKMQQLLLSLLSIVCCFCGKSGVEAFRRLSVAHPSLPLPFTHSLTHSLHRNSGNEKSLGLSNEKVSVAEAEDEHSPIFMFYREKHQGIPSTLSYDDLKLMVPQRFDLNVLDQVFKSWEIVAVKSNLAHIALENQNAFDTVTFPHDHHQYRSDMKVTYDHQGSTTRYLTIKLPNNGFIYPPLSDLNVFKTAAYRHRANSWVNLDMSHISQFPHMIAYAKQFLNVDRVFCKLFYDFNNKGFDFKAFDRRNGTDCVCFSFDFLETVDHEFDVDYWLEA